MRLRTSLLSGLCTLSLAAFASCDGTVVTKPDLPPADTSDVDILDPDVPDVPDTNDTTDVPETQDTDTTVPDDVDTTDVPETQDTDTTDTPDVPDVQDTDTTPVDPCVPNPCTTPPDRCVGNTLERYTSPGTCTNDAQCDYALASSTDCTATNQVCSQTTKTCVFPDLALAIESTTPADGATDVDDDTVIAIAFNQSMNAATLTGQTTAGTCTGNVQLSLDGFSTCVAFTSATASLSGDGKTATLVPRAPLTWGMPYTLRVGANVAGGNGRTLGSAQTFSFRTGSFNACGGARVVISQIYGGGGSTGLFSHDFVELKNRTAAPISLAGWSLQYGSNSGTSTWANRVLLEGVIPAGGYWLVQLGNSGSNPNALPTADQTAAFNIAQAAGKVALVAGTTLLSGACPTSSSLIDVIGYGNSNCSEGTPTALATATTAVHRRIAGCIDTANNLNNTLIAAPRPRNSASTPAFCGCSSDVVAPEANAADYCVLQFPAAIAVDHGVALPDVYGRIYEAGLTDTTTGQAPGVLAQLGYGPLGSDPISHHDWVYYDARFNLEVGNDDEYAATIPTPTTVPLAIASFAYTYRMSLDGGASWTWCDLDGAGSNPGLGFDAGRLGRMDIGPNLCEPNPCTTPSPVGVCDGDQIRVQVGPGTCAVVNNAASCTYGTAAGTDCAATGDRCLGGACVECLGDTDCGGTEVCTQNACVERNPCAPNPCTESRAPTCDGNTLVTPANPGVCTVTGENPSCDYDTTATRTNCPAGCNNGACIAPLLTVTATHPTAAATNVDPGTALTVDFSAAIDAATATAQSTAGACTGSFQLSYNNFTSCVPLTATVAAARVTLTPTRPLTHGIGYTLRVTTALRSTVGGALTAAHDVAFSTPSALGPCGAIVTMSQIYGGGGNAGATFTHDYIVLRNRTAKPVALDGWSLQYTSATGTNWGSGTNLVALSGVINPGGRFLVQLAAGTNTLGALPTPDQTGGINLSANNGKVALVTGTTTLTQVVCPDTNRLIDFFAYGTASECGTFGRAAALTATTAAHRDVAGCVDHDTNTSDFFVGAPNPLNSTAPASFCACTTEAVRNETDHPLEVDFCNLQHPPTLSLPANTTTPDVFGRVYQAGLTTGAGQAAGIKTQLGFGRAAADPLQQRDWVFLPTTFNAEFGNDDEYRGTFVTPIAPDLTTYHYTYRVSLDDGASWTYCDLDGAGKNSGQTFEASKLGVLTIGGSVCAPNPCTTPGAPFCQGDIVQTPAATGTCTVVNSAPQCSYANTPTDCAALGQRCEAGACVEIPVDRLVLETSSPANGATGVEIGDILIFEFDEALDPATVTAVATTGACTGNIQVSYDNFTTCIGVDTVLDDGDTTLLVAPDAFAYGVTYQVRLTTGLRSVLGHQLAATVTQSFTTEAADLCDGTAVVISQVYAAGGTSGATFSHDFVELKNRTGQPLVLDGWSLQVVNGSGGGRTTTVVPLRGTLRAGGFHLVQLAGGTGTALPTPDQTATADIGAAAAVVLASTVATAGCDGAAILDRVAFGASDCGANPLPALTATSAWTRDVLGCSAVGVLASDFVRATPAPKHGATAPVHCACTDDLAVNDSTNPAWTALEVDFCNIQFPPSVAVMPGASSALIYGQVYHDGLTTQAGQAQGIVAQLGFGPAGSDPTAQRHWAFIAGTFNGEVGNNDEYQGVLPGVPLTEGNRSYAYTWRMSRDNGQSWTYCDKNGAGRNGGLDFSPTELGLMVVGAQCTRDAECQAGGECNPANYQCEYPPLTIGYCRLHFPETATVDVGGAVDLYGRVYIAGLTDRTANANDPDTLGRVVAQAGHGPTGSDPSTWTWGTNGIPTPDFVGPGGNDTNNDEYRASFTAGTAGTFDMAIRFSGDGGTTWLYCDKDGATNAGDYSPAQAGVLTVNGASAPVTLYTQNFDALPSTTTPAPSLTIFTNALPGWAFAASGTAAYQVGNGSGTAGGFYSFGTTSATERALGGLASNGTGNQNWGVCYTNNGTSALTNLTVTYVGEQWRANNTAAQSLEVSYSLTIAANALATSLVGDTNWTRVSELDFVSPILSSAGAIDGNTAANRTAKTHTLTGTLPVNGTLCLRWRDLNDSGNDHGLAIDDLVLTGIPQ